MKPQASNNPAPVSDCEASFRQLSELLPVAVYVCDRAGLILQHNPAAVTLWGRAPRLGDASERFCGSFKIFRPDGTPLPHDQCPMAETVRTGQPIRNAEIVIERPDGLRATAVVNTAPIRNDRGELVGAVNSLLDITKRQQAEQALRASESNMAAAQRIAHFGSWELDLTASENVDANPLRWSNEMFRIAGYEPRAVAVSNELFFRLVPPEEHELVRSAVATAIRERQPYSIVHRLVRPDGDERIVQETAQVFFDERTGRPLKLIGTAHDITDRKRAESALKASEARLQAIMDHSPAVIFLKDLTGRYLHVNRRFEQEFGLSRDAILGRTDLEIFPREQAESFRANDTAVLHRGASCHFEEVARYTDGEHFSIVSKFPLLDATGKIYALCGFAFDITERKQAEAALQQSEREQRRLVEQLEWERARLIEAQALAKVGSWETDLPSLNVTWSEETYRIFEADPLHFQPTHAGFLEFIHPEDRAKVNAAFVASLDQLSPCLIEHRIVTPDGQVKIVEERWQMFADDHGQPVRAVGTCHDITERRQAEAQLRQSEGRFSKVFHASPVAIVITTLAEGRYVDVNEFFLEMFGYRREEVIGQTALGLGIWAEPAQRAAIMEALRAGRQVRDVECQFRTKSGALRTALVSVELIRLGDTPCWLFINHDITDRKETQAELRQSLDQLRRLTARLQATREEERTRISREVHDELGQMMTVLKMELTWLANKLPPELPALSDKAREVKTLIEKTALAVRRIATEMRPGVLDDLGLVAALEWQAEEFQKRTGIACRVETDAENLTLDPARATGVFRIFQEALTNVTRHANATRVEARLRVQEGTLTLALQDNGRGITAPEISGTGSLGLVGMRERAALLGGTVRITGEPGKGTKLELSLPVQANSPPP